VISGDTGPLDRLIAQQHNRGLRQVVRRELAKLPAAQQVALRQFHFDGKSVGEIALSLREPVQTIHSRLRRARGALGRSRVLHRWWQDVRDLQSS
jgi:DNA-directed RNA polymerase specialized sigma24 family protein